MSSDRVKFDIACALSIVSDSSELPNIFPDRLAVQGRLHDILVQCIDLGTLEESSCKLRQDVPQSDAYALSVGKDKLRLAPRGSIILGGAGVTVQLHDPTIKRSFALKVPRVSVLAYKYPTFEEFDKENFIARFSSEFKAFENERLIFRRLSHEHVAQHLYGSGKSVPFGKDDAFSTRAQLPFSISEWIDGAQPLHKYLQAYLPNKDKQKELSLDRVISLIMQSFEALAHLQERRVLHWDIKGDNLLVSGSHTIKLIDFGNAKKLDLLDSKADLVATTTEGKYPPLPQFAKEDTGQSESRRFQIKLPHLSWNDPFIDVWMLAQEWNRCLNISPRFLVGGDRGDGKGQPTPEQRIQLHDLLSQATNSKNFDRLDCLRVIFDRALFPFDTRYRSKFQQETTFSPDSLYFGRQDRYASAAEIVAELRRVNSPFGEGARISELQVSLDDIVRLPVTGNSVFTARIEALIETALVRPSDKHNQLAQVRKVFPGATHSRFEHLLGTVTTATYFIRSLYLNEMNAFWRTSVTARDIDATLIASILHDVGHIAFGHFLEEMTDFFSGLKHTDYTIAVLDRCLERLGVQPIESAAAQFFNVSATVADELNSVIMENWIRGEDVQPDGGLREQVIALIQQIRDIFDHRPVSIDLPLYLSREGTRTSVNAIMRSIIDGPLDADKLDYLRRDALHTGVLFASGIDLERFFESLRVCIHTDEKDAAVKPAIGVSEKGIAPIESIITARYQLFAVVYWHRITRSITAILQRVLSEVFLAKNDADWVEFLKELLLEFRERSDDQALDWLNRTLAKRQGKSKPISAKKLGDIDQGMTVQSLVDALLGDRKKYFKVAFELSYIAPMALVTARNRGRFGREKLHDGISQEVYGKKSKPNGLTELSAARKHQTELAEFRRKLEKKFQKTIRDLGHHSYKIDTILLDIPEPGKDQISSIQVDTRTKRSPVHENLATDLEKLFPKSVITKKPEFAELTRLSPVASSLDSALNLWARKIRIFMTPGDLQQLTAMKFSAGDISLIWQRILYDHFEIQDEDQSEFALG
jgi:HD superfamily phosphohydrolase